MKRRRNFKKNKSLKSKVSNLSRKVNNILTSRESKFHRENINATVDSNTGNFIILNAVEQGDTDTTRDGDKIHCTFVSIRGCVAIDNSSVALKVNTFRIILLIDKSVTIGSAGDVLEQVNINVTPGQPYKHDRKQQFSVLKSMFFSIGGGGSSVRSFVINKKLNMNTQFNAGTNNITQNCLALLVISDEVSASGTKPTLDYSSTVYYTDS